MKNSLPPAPAAITTAEGRDLWAMILKAYVLEDVALTMLESACCCMDRIVEARAIIQAEGMTPKDRFGQAKVHPAVLIERDYRGLMLRKLKALGLDLEPLHDAPGRPAGATNIRIAR